MSKIIALIVTILLLLGAVGYAVNHFTEAANKKKVERILLKYQTEIAEMQKKIDTLERQADDARKKAAQSKQRATAYRVQRESIQIPKSAEETVERMHKAGFKSARILR